MAGEWDVSRMTGEGVRSVLGVAVAVVWLVAKAKPVIACSGGCVTEVWSLAYSVVDGKQQAAEPHASVPVHDHGLLCWRGSGNVLTRATLWVSPHPADPKGKRVRTPLG